MQELTTFSLIIISVEEHFFSLCIICLHWVLVAAREIVLAVHRLLSRCDIRAPECTGLLVAPQYVGSQFPDQGSRLRPLHWKADS